MQGSNLASHRRDLRGMCTDRGLNGRDVRRMLSERVLNRGKLCSDVLLQGATRCRPPRRGTAIILFTAPTAVVLTALPSRSCRLSWCWACRRSSWVRPRTEGTRVCHLLVCVGRRESNRRMCALRIKEDSVLTRSASTPKAVGVVRISSRVGSVQVVIVLFVHLTQEGFPALGWGPEERGCKEGVGTTKPVLCPEYK